MADGAQPAGGGHWPAAAPPNFRAQVVQTIARNLAGVYRCQLWQVHNVAAKFEVTVLRESNSMQDYLRRISRKMLHLQQKQQQVVQVSSDHQQQAQIVPQMQPTDAVQANSSVATMSVPGRPPQLQNMHVKVKQEQPSPTVVTHIQTQCPARQLQPTTFAGCNPTSAAGLQGQPVVRPNAQQNHLLRHNSTGICTQQPQPQLQQLMRMDQQDLMVNQQQANVAVMQIGHPGGQNTQQFESPRASAANGSAGGVDWRGDMFQKITSLKDDYFSELAEFDRTIVLQRKTDEQLESLPKEKADRYRYAVKLKGTIRNVLTFLQLQRSNIPEGMKEQFDKYQVALRALLRFYRGSKARIAERNAGRRLPQNFREPSQIINSTGGGGGAAATPSTGGTDSQQKQHEQPAKSICRSMQNIAATPPLARQQNHGDHLVGQAEDDGVRGGAEAPVAVNLTDGECDTAPFTGGTCSQEIQHEQLADERIVRLMTQDVPAAATPPAPQQQSHSAHSLGVGQAADDEVLGGPEETVAMETLIKRGVDAARSLSPAARRSLANDMGVNLKRAFRYTTSPGCMDGSCVSFERDAWWESGYKKRKTRNGALLDEIRVAYSMLVDTVIGVAAGYGGADGSTVIEFCYNVVSLAPDLRSAINAPEISTKLLVPADYPRNSPVLVDNGEPRDGILGAVDVVFRRALCELPEPMSVEDMAKVWEACVQRAVVEFAHRQSGGTSDTKIHI